MDIFERFWSKVLPPNENGCRLWIGQSFETHGNRYGLFQVFKKGDDRIRVPAHVFSFELEHGPVPDGLVLDHKCRTGLCVEENHLEPVTDAENILRGNGAPAVNARKTHCLNGHELTTDNVWSRYDGRRACKQCDRNRVRK